MVGVTAARGFAVAAAHVGIKAEGVLDATLVVSAQPATMAACLTRNRVQAAPVQWCQNLLRLPRWRRQARAVLLTSGNANACTGVAGKHAASACARAAAQALGCDRRAIWLASTGIIGVPLPVQTICLGQPQLAAQLRRGPAADRRAARAILTTDTRIKLAQASARSGRSTYRVGGMAKGSGMIHPNMGTMLACITCDAPLAPAQAQRLLRLAVDASFNTISVDGDTSTNDSVFLLCNGAAGGAVAPGSAAERALLAALTRVCVALAEAIAADGEGATALLLCQVVGARSHAAAARIARTVVASPLVKCALTGHDPNWGRIVAAAGRAGEALRPGALGLDIGGVALLRDGQPLADGRALRRAATAMRRRRVQLTLRVGGGVGVGWARGCNLTHAYVDINTAYS